MKTTLNLPDSMVLQAKRQALEDGTTLTSLIVEGLKARLEKTQPHGQLPISIAVGGLQDGVSWETLEVAEDESETYR
jgi:hypothetical protein